MSNGYWGTYERATVVMTGDGPEPGWESEPEFCRPAPGRITDEDRRIAATTYLLNVPGTQKYLRVENGADEQVELGDFLNERGKWTREQDEQERLGNE